MLPRRNSSHSTWPSSARSTASPLARQLGGDLVGELDLLTHSELRSRTSAETRLPSARPSTSAIAAFITWPMSFGDVAPVSAIARGTIPRSSASGSSAGR